jgi:hypothetical protein
MKGQFNGNCNITSCQKPGANWFNHSTRAYYCSSCGNRLNKDPFNMKHSACLYDGHLLCSKVLSQEEFEDVYGESIMTVLEQSGRTNEMDFDLEAEMQKRYNDHVTKVTTTKYK